MVTMKYTVLITIVALVYTFILSARVGARRLKLGIDAPAISGQAEFDIAFRIHMNTIEQLVLFIPMLWIAVTVVGDVWAAAIGAIWVIGRIIYAIGYTAGIDKRGPGMLITVLSTVALTVISFWGVVQAFMA
jgi:glutathione S-transferase